MNLLIVDDEPVIRKGLVRMAEQYHSSLASIYTANNGVHALEVVQEHKPEIIFTDIRMPKMDGLELCRHIHEQYDHIQTVVISGYGDFAYAQQCLTYGVKHYLLKPVTKPDVHAILDKLLNKPVKGYIPISRYVEWIDQADQCIWSLDQEKLKKLVQQWKEDCFSTGMNALQCSELLKDCISMLERRLQARDSSFPRISSEYMGARTREEAFDFFERQLERIMDELSLKRNGRFKDPLEEAKAYIELHLSEEISLEEVAEKAGFTPNYFSSLFKKMTNETFVQYRIKRRMEKAQQLLAVPHFRIVDVAAEVGYEDYPHFTKMFKKVTGQSPSEYRAKLGIK
ncbi:sigma-54 dependent response regulator [Chlamydia abortus]|nr:sigma-54 dependent response regulator [Chlamydia abortus]